VRWLVVLVLVALWAASAQPGGASATGPEGLAAEVAQGAAPAPSDPGDNALPGRAPPPPPARRTNRVRPATAARPVRARRPGGPQARAPPTCRVRLSSP